MHSWGKYAVLLIEPHVKNTRGPSFHATSPDAADRARQAKKTVWLPCPGCRGPTPAPQGQPCLCSSCETTSSDFEREARNLSFKGNLQTFKRWPNFQKHRVGRTHHTHQPSAGAHLVGVPTRGLGSFLLFRELAGPLRISGSKKPQWRAKKTDSQLTTLAAGPWELEACPPASCVLLSHLPTSLSFLPPSPSLSVICLSLSLSISCSLSVHLQVAAFHLHPPVSLLCRPLSRSTSPDLSVSPRLSAFVSLPVCVSVSLCLCIYISLSLYLSMSRPISLLRSLKPEIRFPSSACSKVHLRVSQGARAVDNC